MQYDKETTYRPSMDAITRVKTSGNIIEVMTTEHKSRGGTTRKIDKDSYMDTRTGEVKDYQHHETRADDVNSVSRSLAYGRDLLNANVTDPTHCRWLTLTYAENMQDPARLQEDFERFNRRCRKDFGHYEYITAAEPQARGAWHLHVVMIWNGQAPYIPNAEVARMWGKGFVQIKALENIDNVGAYLTAYLADIAVPDDMPTETAERVGTVKTVDSKRYIKGMRLHLYPAQMHIFRWSKGVRRPTVTYMTYQQAKEQVGAATPTYQKAIYMTDDDTGYRNTLYYEYYNTARKECQVEVDDDLPW